jgi:hypothetical protein
MRADQLGWYYFNGQMRYKDGNGWTERYKPVDGPGATSTRVKVQFADGATAPTPPVVRQPRRRLSLLLTALCAGLLGVAVGGAVVNPAAMHGWFSWANDQASQVSSLFSPQAPSTQVPLADPQAQVKAAPAQRVAPTVTGAGRDVNAFAMGGPPPATVPVGYDHPSHPDCLKFRDQVRAWSDFQNAHRPPGFSRDLPSSGDVQYLLTACGLSY